MFHRLVKSGFSVSEGGVQSVACGVIAAGSCCDYTEVLSSKTTRNNYSVFLCEALIRYLSASMLT